MKSINIKCFRTPRKKYFYDRYLNSVVSVEDREYSELLEVERTGNILDKSKLNRFIDEGLLHKTIIKKIEHPDTKNLKYLSETSIGQLILQVTQQCNLRCKYCAYSGNYFNREHNSKKMSFKIAKNAINFYIARTKEVDELSFAFYGGEPFLEYELIKECVEYINLKRGDKPARFNMTTNATLLTQEKLDFLIKNNFAIMISLDGPKETHDVNRKFISGQGSFNTTMRNMSRIKAYNKKYYLDKVSFNCVISVSTEIEKLYDFFGNPKYFEPNQIHFSYVDSNGIKDNRIGIILKRNERAKKLEYIKMLMSVIGRRKWDNKSVMLRSSIDDIEILYNQLHRHTPESQAMHHSGPCLAGVRRLFIDTNGVFFPCERVSEEDSQMNIGSLKNGFDYNKMDLFINHGKMIEENCMSCWNLRLCLFCIGGIDKCNKEVCPEMLLQKCEESKSRQEMLIEQLCILTELGYRGNAALKILK